MKEEIIQHLLLPEGELKDNWKLYYQGTRGSIGDQDGKTFLAIPKYDYVHFYTYLNGCSLQKWKRYTHCKTVTLRLVVQGRVRITFAGYSRPAFKPEKKIFDEMEFDLDTPSEIVYTYPDNDEQIVGFEVDTLTEAIIYGGTYSAVYDDGVELNPVELSIAATTMNKEAFIKRNIKALYDGIFELPDDMKNHFHIHIVDNGRTLKREDFPDHPFIELHPNKNVGGSGGYARGMIEAIHQNPKATNVLLMDDDVLVIPDSVFRIYKLLRLEKDEYKHFFIEGAMLYYEDRNYQHEDIGTVDNKGIFHPEKPRYHLTELKDILDNERDFPRHPRQYGAWWCCCIPMMQIEKNGLPLPLFIRGDDVEFGLRCKAEIITMNGICIWHMGFTNKYNASFNLYQQLRNLLIDQATTGVMQGVDIMFNITHQFRICMMGFNYNAAEILIRALEDYLKGPKWLEEDHGEEIVKANGKLNENLVSIFDIDKDLYFNLNEVFMDTKRSQSKRLLYGATYNGQRFYPKSWLKKDPAYIPFNDAYTPSKMSFHETVIAINPETRMGAVRKQDRERFRTLLKRYHAVMKKYDQEHKNVNAAYAADKDYMTSEKFWNKYLEFDQYHRD